MQSVCLPSADAVYLIKKSLADVGCNAVWTCRQIPKFRRKILSPFSALKTNIDIFTSTRTSHLIKKFLVIE
jgi:hypothetical protein